MFFLIANLLNFGTRKVDLLCSAAKLLACQKLMFLSILANLTICAIIYEIRYYVYVGGQSFSSHINHQGQRQGVLVRL